MQETSTEANLMPDEIRNYEELISELLIPIMGKRMQVGKEPSKHAGR